MTQPVYNSLISDYNFDDRQLICIYPIGSPNYDLYIEKKSNIEFYAVIMPTLEQLSLGEFCPTKDLSIGVNIICKTIDLRNWAKGILSTDLLYLEGLFSSDLWVNDLYKKVFETELLNNAELFVRINQYALGKHILDNLKNFSDNIIKGSVVANKSFYHALRYKYMFDTLFQKNGSFKKALIPEGKSKLFLINLKDNPNPIPEKELRLYSSTFLKELVTDTILLEKLPKEDKETVIQFKQAIIELVKNNLYLKKNSLQQLFEDNLTILEKKAYDDIISMLGEKGCGNIVVKEYAKRNNISNSTYSNLFKKLIKYDLAYVANQGVKGTFIDFRKGKSSE